MSAVSQTWAALNAALNGTSALLLLAGFVAIRSGRRDVHKRCMLTAFSVSCIFLVSYLLRVALYGTHYYPGRGTWKAIYYFVLFSHMTLAATTPPLVVRALYLALKQRFAEHRRVVRFALPVWGYVSSTGVLVYWLLYHPPG